MKKIFVLSLMTTFLSAPLAMATNVHCTFEHGETLSYNEKSQRLTIVDPHTSDPKVETLIYDKVKLISEGGRGKDGKLNSLKLVNAQNKVVSEVKREATADAETGIVVDFKGTWDVGFGKLSGACTLSK